MRTGDGDLKKERMVPFFFFILDCAVDLGFLAGAATMVVLSSSVVGGEEREESESGMAAALCVCRGCWW